MELGMIGLGRMGGNMGKRLLRGGHRLVVYDPRKEAAAELAKEGGIETASIPELIQKLPKPRAIWVMVPSGEPTGKVIQELSAKLGPGDIVIDGGNSYYKDTMKRAENLARMGISLLDAGTSGGVWGLEEGYCLMIGGDLYAYRRLEPLFQTLAPSSQTGYSHVGLTGAGHFVNMVHNAIECGIMESYAEGFELMKAKGEFNLDLSLVADTWRHGSVIRSWLLDITSAALKDDPSLERIQPYVEDSGEEKWAVTESINLAVPAPAITSALQTRFRSRQEQPFGSKLLAAMRNTFGGHPG